MADYTSAKNNLGAVFPVGQIESTWTRVEPLITPVLLRTLHLWGIPLVSAMRDPITGKSAVMDDEILKVYIDRAVSIAEAETGLDIFPIYRQEKKAFDKCEYEAFGFFRTSWRPVATIQAITVTPSNDEDVFTVPLEWVETGYLFRGEINLIPLTVALRSGTVVPLSTSAGGATFLSIFGHKPWIPAFWKLAYTTGFPDGKVPKIVNELIGCVAAMEVLSMLASTYARTNSSSLSLDGMSQSVSTPGPNLFKIRLDELATKREMLTDRLKKLYGLSIFSSNV